MMTIAGIPIQQDGQTYALYTPQGIPISMIYMPPDLQLLQDAAALNVICKAMVKRWGISNKGN